MVYTVQLMLKKFRSQSLDNINDPSLDEDVEMSYLDDAHQMVTDVILDTRPELLSYYFDLTLTGASSYFIPNYIKYDYEDILLVEDITDTATPIGTMPDDWFNRMNYFEGMDTKRIPWSIRDQYIEFPELQDSITLRVWYTRRPVGLFYGTVAANAGSTDVKFPSAPTMGEVLTIDDYYNGMKVYVGGEIKWITDYVGATRVATVNSAWVTTPTTVSIVELMSPLPERIHPLIVDVATRKLKIINEDEDRQIAKYIEEEVLKLVGRMKPQRQMPRQIRKIER